MTFRRLLPFTFIIAALTLWSCQTKGPDSPEKAPAGRPGSSEKLMVLTTIAPLYSFTTNVAGDAAGVENLLPSGAGPHEYSLSPQDAKKIADAQVLIINGVGLEAWLDKAINSAGTHRTGEGRLILADTSAGVEIINRDPHIWLSPKNAVIQVRNIRDAMITADPAHANIYEANAGAYITRLNDLDREIRDEIRTWGKREFVALHSAFSYFARDYGLKQAAVVQEIPETEPSPRHIASVIAIIKSRDIKSIFTEPQSSHKIVNSLASDLGLRVYSIDTLEKGSPGKEWYEERMRANLAVLREALK